MRAMTKAPRARRAWLAAVVAATAACDSLPYRTITVPVAAPDPAPAGSAAAPTTPPLRFAVASIQSPRYTYAGYSPLFGRVARTLGREAELVQRKTYRDINELLISGGLDVALLCTGGYLDLERRAPGAVEVAAIPVPADGATYRAKIIVPADSPARTLKDLRGQRFAFTDELSMTGRLYLLKLLRDGGHDPERFFGGVTYSGGHDRSIYAVAAGLVDGAVVHGLVYAQLLERDPSLAERVKVIYRSPPLGAMPIVVSTRLPREVRERIRRALLDMGGDGDGAGALRALGFERLVAPPPDVYHATARLLEARR
jgi:phosphonate transport system substrate-binding protein